MANPHNPAPVSQAEIDRAATLWKKFTLLLKCVVAIAIIVLGGMALFLV